MKKFIIISILALFCYAVQSQVLTKNQLKFSNGSTFLSYAGTSVDTLTANQDSISFPIFVNNNHLYKVTAFATFLRVGASDTICKLSLYGKSFGDEAYTHISNTSSAAITSTTVLTPITAAYGTAIQHRFLKINVVRPVPITGAGTKVILKELEVKITEQ